jgi:hypothetical protein
MWFTRFLVLLVLSFIREIGVLRVIGGIQGILELGPLRLLRKVCD